MDIFLVYSGTILISCLVWYSMEGYFFPQSLCSWETVFIINLAVATKAWIPPLLQVMIDMNKVKKVLGINQV